MKHYDVCIIGAGAAGLAAAVTLNEELHVCILEKNQSSGRKLSATGGGRCNITNAAAANAAEVVSFFRGIGLEVSPDSEGRYYPYSGRASDVVEALVAAAEQKNIDRITEFSASDVQYGDGKFSVSNDGKPGGIITASKLILATGGKSYPEFGTTGDGYRLAKSLGHTVNRVYPILTPVVCAGTADFAGIRARGRVTLLKDGQPVSSSKGEIQFTRDGVSGICVFDLTLDMKAEDGETPGEAMKRYELELDLAPDFTEEDLAGRTSSFGIVTRKLADRISPGELKQYRLPVTGLKGWKHAQCTGGGVSLSQIDEHTMESVFVPGLYFAGEILDRQYPCGGFNLNHAWITGIRAATHINKMLKGNDSACDTESVR